MCKKGKKEKIVSFFILFSLLMNCKFSEIFILLLILSQIYHGVKKAWAKFFIIFFLIFSKFFSIADPPPPPPNVMVHMQSNIVNLQVN